MFKLKSGDKIKVIKGRDRGKEGIIKEVSPVEKTLLLEGINLYKKHQKAQGEKKPGGIITIIKPIRVENVRLICPKCLQITKVGIRVEKDHETKYRYCKKCKEVIK